MEMCDIVPFMSSLRKVCELFQVTRHSGTEIQSHMQTLMSYINYV